VRESSQNNRESGEQAKAIGQACKLYAGSSHERYKGGLKNSAKRTIKDISKKGKARYSKDLR
jgi:hypothetical protein